MVVGGGSGNLAIAAAYDYGFGLITSSTDFNGNLTTYQYDSFGRLVRGGSSGGHDGIAHVAL